MNPGLESIDHLVLTVADISATENFYARVLGVPTITFGQNRRALQIGTQKINLHQAGKEFEPKALQPTPGAADLCFLSAYPLADWLSHLARCGVDVIDGPVMRTGAQGAIESIYIRDLDGNLIEIANQK